MATVTTKHRLAAVALLLTAVVAAVLLQWKPARSITLLVPPLAGFVEVGPDIWVERGMTAETRGAAVQAVSLARARLRSSTPSRLDTRSCWSARL